LAGFQVHGHSVSILLGLFTLRANCVAIDELVDRSFSNAHAPADFHHFQVNAPQDPRPYRGGFDPETISGLSNGQQPVRLLLFGHEKLLSEAN
jgi:hypothetical protein